MYVRNDLLQRKNEFCLIAFHLELLLDLVKAHSRRWLFPLGSRQFEELKQYKIGRLLPIPAIREQLAPQTTDLMNKAH
jgi:hypothetical protein